MVFEPCSTVFETCMGTIAYEEEPSGDYIGWPVGITDFGQLCGAFVKQSADDAELTPEELPQHPDFHCEELSGTKASGAPWPYETRILSSWGSCASDYSKDLLLVVRGEDRAWKLVSVHGIAAGFRGSGDVEVKAMRFDQLIPGGPPELRVDLVLTEESWDECGNSSHTEDWTTLCAQGARGVRCVCGQLSYASRYTPTDAKTLAEMGPSGERCKGMELGSTSSTAYRIAATFSPEGTVTLKRVAGHALVPMGTFPVAKLFGE